MRVVARTKESDVGADGSVMSRLQPVLKRKRPGNKPTGKKKGGKEKEKVREKRKIPKSVRQGGGKK